MCVRLLSDSYVRFICLHQHSRTERLGHVRWLSCFGETEGQLASFSAMKYRGVGYTLQGIGTFGNVDLFRGQATSVRSGPRRRGRRLAENCSTLLDHREISHCESSWTAPWKGSQFREKRDMAVQRVLALRAAMCVVSVILLSWVPAFAQDTAPAQTDLARPRSEELAIPTYENQAGAQKHAEGARDNEASETLCLIIESAGKATDLPLEFFARVIWQESRFQSEAVGPVTHNGQRAQGIAQFMPGTASQRGLLDPFNPVQALPKSAEFLSELRNQFGNLGLAAAAYNAGPKRVQDWLAGSGYMPQETRNYVSAITGSSIDDWAKAGRTGKMPGRPQTSSCRELIALLKAAPNTFVTQLEHRVMLATAKHWGVQVAAGFNRDNALAMYARAMKGLPAMVGKRDDPLLVHSRGTSTFYQVQIGTDTRREADNLCSHMRRAGGACLVKRNKDEGLQISRANGHVARRVHAHWRTIPPGPRDGRPL
jgi:soluble lytic murein transglycosylase-like protein